MGYRYYFYKVKLKDVNRIKDLSLNELEEIFYNKNDEYYDFDKVIDKKEIFEFGKLYLDNTAELIYSTSVPLFFNSDVMRVFEYYHPYVAGKKGLLKAIEIYQYKIIEYLEDCMLDTYDEFGRRPETSKEKIEEDIVDRWKYWKSKDVLNLNEENKELVTNSWLYEYSIFNLVHLLKTIDWEKETILFCGW